MSGGAHAFYTCRREMSLEFVDLSLELAKLTDKESVS